MSNESCVKNKNHKLLRKWTKFNKETKNAFTLVSYNILSQKCLDNHLYLYKDILQSETRIKALYHELKSYAAQIICLQEVEPHLLKILRKCVWSRNNEIDVVYAQCNPPRTDGCAILVNSQRFSIINVKRINLNAGENKPNTGIIVTLNDKQGDNILIIACTHLLFNPKRGDIRLRQCISFIHEIEEAKSKAKMNTQKNVKVIVTGDFNSYPNSAIYSYLIKGYINKNALTKRTKNDNNREHPFKYVNQRCITDLKPYPDININRNLISHSLQLKSIYAINEGENAFTTYISNGTKACVDYIFANNLIPIGRLEIPLVEELREGLPSHKYSSDHIALVARFA